MNLMDDSSRAVYLLDKQIIQMNRKSPLILEISGNSQTILNLRKGVQKGEYKYLKINVSGAGMQSFGYCCFYTIITLTILFFFPLFLLCKDCVKRKIYVLFNINWQVYDAIGRIIAATDPTECYITVEDNYFNEDKARRIQQGIQRTNLNKLQFVNIASGLDINGNYRNFKDYMKPLSDISKESRCRWADRSI